MIRPSAAPALAVLLAAASVACRPHEEAAPPAGGPPTEAAVRGWKLAGGPAAEAGRELFFDTALSNPPGQSCASCHRPEHGFAEPLARSRGADPAHVGTRNAPTLLYAASVPAPFDNPASPLVEVDDAGQIGGLFVDGRAQAFEDQVRVPLFNPLEMNLAGPAELAAKLQAGPHAARLRPLLPAGRSDDEAWTSAAAAALAAFLRDPRFAPFDSRVDRFIAGERGALTPQEESGFNLFQSSRTRCATCHAFDGTAGARDPFTDHSYVNLGLPQPKGLERDPGQGRITGKSSDLGRFRVPTLRNAGVTGPWMHDGSLEKLADVVSFYNTRDTDPKRWHGTAYPETVHHRDVGDLGMTREEEAALVAFLEALTDRAWEKPGDPR